jgi:UDP-N-acetylmuramate: L-alanyl-gamma-D-glutamyl-meso-diaminopimelate ligase
VLCELVDASHWSLLKIPYNEHPYSIDAGRFVLNTKYGEVPLMLFGRHNMQNIQGALLICREMGIKDHQFYDSVQNFKGAERRQQLLASGKGISVYLDYAHAPSKVAASVNAFRETYPDQILYACLELHTDSSLNKEFLPQYRGTLDDADHAMVFYSPANVKKKKLPPLSQEEIKASFNRDDLLIYSESGRLEQALKGIRDKNCTVLLMTSGNFSGMDLHQLAKEMVQG